MGRFLAAALVLAAGCSGGTPVPAPTPAPAPAPSPAEVPADLPDPPGEPWETEPDPVRARTLKLEFAARHDPALVGFELEIRDLRPVHLIVVKEGPGAIDFPAAEALGAALRDQIRRFRDFLRTAGVEVPALEAMEDLRIGLLLFPNEGIFESWQLKNKMPHRERSYADYRERRLVGWTGDLDARAVRHLGTLLLLNIYRSHFVAAEDIAKGGDRNAPPSIASEDPRTRGSFAWFDRGLAHILSGEEPGDSIRLGKTDFAALQFARSTNRLWPLADFLFADDGQVRARAGVRGGGFPETGFVHLQGALLVDRLLWAGDGRWRDGFHAVIRNEIQGRSGRVFLAEAYGLPERHSDPAWHSWIRDVETACLAALE